MKRIVALTDNLTIDVNARVEQVIPGRSSLEVTVSGLRGRVRPESRGS